MKDWKKRLAYCPMKKKHHRSAVGQLNWVAGISRRNMFFSSWSQHKTQTSNSGRRNICQQNNKNVKNSKNAINLPQLNLNNIKLQLFTDTSFKHLPNGSQAGQIISNRWQKQHMLTLLEFFQNQKSSKINHSSRDIVSFRGEGGGGNVAMYINKLVSKLWFHDGKQLNIIAYTDNESLYDAVQTLKQTAHDLLRKWLNYELAI